MQLVSQNPEDTRAIAATLSRRLLELMQGRSSALVVALEGELGAGKTALVQGIAAALGVREQLKSPTFNLVKKYAIPNTTYVLWHLDCYRLTGHADLAPLDMQNIWSDPTALVLVEWSERIASALPPDHVTVKMTHLPASKAGEGADKRGITIIEP